MRSLKAETVEKIVGYALLIVGLIIMLFSIWFAFQMLNGKAELPQLIPTPTGEENFAVAFVPIANAFLIFFLFIVIEYGASVITSRGISLIKDAGLKTRKEIVKKEEKTPEITEKTQEVNTTVEESESSSV